MSAKQGEVRYSVDIDVVKLEADGDGGWESVDTVESRPSNALFRDRGKAEELAHILLSQADSASIRRKGEK